MNAQLTHNRRSIRLNLALAAALVPAALAQPALEVRIDGQVQANHSEQFFAPTTVGQTSSIVVVLRNIGNQPLVFTETPPVMLAGGFAESFAIIQPALESGSQLSPNSSTAFRVDFQPTFASGIALFTHVYLWTDASATPFHLVMRGSVQSPKMVVFQDDAEIPDLGSATFPPTEVGQSSEITLRIENQGDAPLSLTETPPALIGGGLGAFMVEVVQQPAAELAPDATTEMRLRFTPQEDRAYFTRLFVANNENSASMNGLFDIDIEATGIAATPADDPNQEENAEEPGNPDGDDNDNGQAGQDDPAGDGQASDPGEQEEEAQAPVGDNQDKDADESDFVEESFADPLMPPLCGFGAPMLAPALLAGLGGMKGYRRPRRKAH